MKYWDNSTGESDLTCKLLGDFPLQVRVPEVIELEGFPDPKGP